MISTKPLTGVACSALLFLAAPAAMAQDDYDSEESSHAEESDSEDEESESSAEASASGSLSASGVSGAMSSQSEGSADGGGGTAPLPPGGSDHAGVVGKLGIGYMGYRTMAVADTGGGEDTVEAPVVGVRYWMNRSMGIDVGLGLSFGGETTTTEMAGGGGPADVESPDPLALILHGGVPLVLSASRHFVFEVVPELNIGFASNTVDVAGTDVDLSGFHLDLGARAGAEIHFGFIDIPQLALQAGLGLRYAMDSFSADDGAGNSVSTSRSSFTTAVGDNPWNILTANIAALYYLD
jgi:hypothetical protein